MKKVLAVLLLAAMPFVMSESEGSCADCTPVAIECVGACCKVECAEGKVLVFCDKKEGTEF